MNAFIHREARTRVRWIRWSRLLLCYLFIASCSGDDAEPQPPAPQSPQGLTPEFLLSEQLTLNPTGYAPLSARLDLRADQPIRVSLRIQGKDGDEDTIQQDFPETGQDLSIPIHGLYAGFENSVRITFYDASGNLLANKDYQLQTAPLLADLPQISIEVADRGRMAPGFTLVSYFGHAGQVLPQRPFIFDARGEIRWYLDYKNHPELSGLFYDDGMERLANGNLYFGSGGGNFGGIPTNKIYEIDLFGTIVDSWAMPGYGFHHEVHEKPNGNFLVTVNELGAATVEDQVIEIDRATKQIIRRWDLKQSLEAGRDVWTTDTEDWFHANAVLFDPTDNSIVVSGRTQGVVKLSEANEPVWILAPHKNWGTSGAGADLTQFLLQPLDASGTAISDPAVLDGDIPHPDFDWNWYQHAPALLPDGTLLMFDNGDSRNYGTSPFYSRAVAYEISAEQLTVRQDWEYGKDRGLETFSRIVSDVDYLASRDHVLFSPGAVNFQGDLYGKSVEVDRASGEVVFEATIRPPMAFFDIITLHRTERMPLYPD